MIGLMRRRTGLPMMSAEITGVSQCRGGLAPAVSLDRRSECSGGECLRGVLGAVRGDGWVPGLAGGDDGVQVPQDRGGDHGLRLGRGELVVLPAGQVLVAGAVDGGWRVALPRPRAMLPGAARGVPARSAWSGR